ncbi:MAG: tRNA (guanosine(37)-N1)-methyltransferase TrmD [Elusimicrobia bacterium]|nr:tRNA (guanosine(37)-N1)-methyltransferase TrmD [Elusimicrobiota bacterium]
MRFDVVTLFPRMVDAPLSESIVGRARERGQLELGFANPRDFTQDRHRTVDDRPYGGGPGMLMMAEPLFRAVKSVKKRGSLVVVLSPHGRRFDQKTARRLAARRHVVLVCGRYEGMDARFVAAAADEELSLGDFVLTGGEAAAVAVIDSVARLLPGVLKKEEAPVLESFTGPLLEAPQYTRPSRWRGKSVPSVLLGGNHAAIEAWRRKKAQALTKRKRPDLLRNTEA